jgi:hypothetical protein
VFGILEVIHNTAGGIKRKETRGDERKGVERRLVYTIM